MKRTDATDVFENSSDLIIGSTMRRSREDNREEGLIM